MLNFISLLTPKSWFMIAGSIFVLTVLWKFHSLSNEIKELKEIIQNKELAINNLTLANKVSEASVTRLKDELEISNKNLTDIIEERKLLKIDIEKYKQQSITSKIKNKELQDIISKVNSRLNKTKEEVCKEGIDLNKKISELKYEDL